MAFGTVGIEVSKYGCVTRNAEENRIVTRKSYGSTVSNIDPVKIIFCNLVGYRVLTGVGVGSGTFSVDLRGPITRIGTVNSPLTITNGTGSIIIEINPNGLLQPNMYVFGEILLTSFNGETWTIDLELQAESESRIPILDDQSTIIGTFFAVCSVWFTVTFLAEIRTKNEKNETILEQETTFEFD